MEVASRQISEAIRLFFDQRDPIAIHTLVASAHQILFDIGSEKGIGSVVKRLQGLEKGEVRQFLISVNYPYNFFKHADKDPDTRINIGPLSQLTQDFIMDAVLMLQRISGDIPREAQVFWNWFVSFYPEGFDKLPPDGPIARMQEQEFGKMEFHELAAFIKVSDLLEGGS